MSAVYDYKHIDIIMVQMIAFTTQTLNSYFTPGISCIKKINGETTDEIALELLYPSHTQMQAAYVFLYIINAHTTAIENLPGIYLM